MIIKYETRKESWTIWTQLRQLGIQASEPRRGEQRGANKFWWEVETVFSESQMIWGLSSSTNYRLDECQRELAQLRDLVAKLQALLLPAGTEGEASHG